MAYVPDATNVATPPDYGWLLAYVPAELRALKVRIGTVIASVNVTAGSERAAFIPTPYSNFNNGTSEATFPSGGPIRYVAGTPLSSTISGTPPFGPYTRQYPPISTGIVSPNGSANYWFGTGGVQSQDIITLPVGNQLPMINQDIADFSFNGTQVCVTGYSIPGTRNYIWEGWMSGGGIGYSMVTPVPYQVGPVYRPCQSYLPMNSAWSTGTATPFDYFGNYWTFVGSALLQSTTYYGGQVQSLGALGAAGTLTATDGLKTSQFTTLYPIGNKAWTFDILVYVGTVPIASAFAAIFSAVNAAGFGVQIGLYNTAGTVNFAVNISENGSSNVYAAAAAKGTLSVVAGSWYGVKLTYDDIAGRYCMFTSLAGTNSLQPDWNNTAAATLVYPITRFVLGGDTAATAITGFLGTVQSFEFKPYCDMPYTMAGLAIGYGKSLAATINSSGLPQSATVLPVPWLDTTCMTWRCPVQIFTTQPTIPPLGMLPYATSGLTFQGPGTHMPVDLCNSLTMLHSRPTAEFVLNIAGTSVTSVTNYAYNNRYTSLPTALAAVMTFNHNIGFRPNRVYGWLENQIPELGYKPGDRVYVSSIENGSTNGFNFSTSGNNQLIVTMTVTTPTITNQSSGASAAIVAANWKLVVVAEAGIC